MFKYDFNPVGPIIGIRRDNNGMNKIDKENMKYLRSHVSMLARIWILKENDQPKSTM